MKYYNNFENKKIILNISLLDFEYPISYGSIERICRRTELLLKNNYSVILLCKKIDYKLKTRFVGDIYYYEGNINKTIEMLSQINTINIIIIDYVWNAYYLKKFNNKILSILETHDIVNERNIKFTENNVRPFMTEYNKILNYTDSKKEYDEMNKFNIVIAISDNDYKKLNNILTTKVIYVPFINKDKIINFISLEKNYIKYNSKTLVTYGSDTDVNVKSLRHYIINEWFKLKKYNFILYIYGDVCNKIKDIKDDNIFLKYKVNDISSIFRNANICILPNLCQTGISTRLMHCIENCIPTIITQSLCTDFENYNNKCFFSVDSISKINDKILELLNNKLLHKNIRKECSKIAITNTLISSINKYLSSEEYTDINVFTLFRDNENEIPLYEHQISLLEQIYTVNTFIYENDSTDNTVSKLKNMKLNNIKLLSENLNNPKFNSIESKERYKLLSNYRNINHNMSVHNSKWSLIVDTSIEFNTYVINEMIKILEKNPKIAMIVPFSEDNDIPNHYYDTSSFISSDNKFSVYCQFNCTRCNILRDKLFKIHENHELLSVKSAFGGLALIRSEIFENVKWNSDGKCEHILFCKNIRDYGKIVMVPWLNIKWYKKYEKKNFNIFTLFRDNDNYIPYYTDKFNKLENEHKYLNFKYYIYENDSKDSTKIMLNNFMKKKKGTLISLDNNSQYFGQVALPQRFHKLANFRNENIASSYPLKEGWSLLIDSDIYFEIDILDKFFVFMNNWPDMESIVMLTCFGNDRMFPGHYYDTSAFLDIGMHYKHIDTRAICMFTGCSRCDKIAPNRHIYSRTKPLSIDSGFGGFVLIRNDILQKTKWCSKGQCEHLEFCKQVRKYGKIILLPWIQVEWEKDEYKDMKNNNIKTISNIKYNKLNNII